MHAQTKQLRVRWVAPLNKKKSMLALRGSEPRSLPAVVVKADVATLTEEDMRAGCEALVRELGKDKTRLFLEAVINGRLRGESVVERIVRRNPVAAMLAAGAVGATLGALFGPAQLPTLKDEPEP
jgi:hypothetical protein